MRKFRLVVSKRIFLKSPEYIFEKFVYKGDIIRNLFFRLDLEQSIIDWCYQKFISRVHLIPLVEFYIADTRLTSLRSASHASDNKLPLVSIASLIPLAQLCFASRLLLAAPPTWLNSFVGYWAASCLV